MAKSHNREKMLEDLHFIKEAARRNNNILRNINLLQVIRGVALYTGILIFTFSLGLLWAMNYYGSYPSLPSSLNGVVYLLLGLSLIVLGTIKLNMFLRFARSYQKDITLAKLMQEIYTQSVVMIMVPFLMALIVSVIYFSTAGLTQLIVPIITIFIALLLAAFVAILSLKYMLLYVEWLLLSGLFSLFIADKVHPLVILMLTFGVAMIILYLTAVYSSRAEKRV